MANTLNAHPATPSRKQVFIVDDHPVFRKGLAQLINAEQDLAVCGSAGTVAGALESLSGLEPDLVLVDITLPDKSGLELVGELRSKNRQVKLLVVSMHDAALYANRVLRLGADGYIMKQEGPAEIIQAIHDVLKGHIYVSDEILASLSPHTTTRPQPPARPLDLLTDSEMEVLELLGRGQSDEEIAHHLCLSVESVSAACLEMKKKLHLKSDNALVRYAVCWVETGTA